MAGLTQVAPYLGVRDVRVASAHYKRLGFEVEQSGGGDMAIARRDDVSLILVPRGASPLAPSEGIVVWITTDDVGSLRTEWDDQKVGGQTVNPSASTEIFVHTDPDGNRLQVAGRFI